MKYMSMASPEGMCLKNTSVSMCIKDKYLINNKKISKVSQL